MDYSERAARGQQIDRLRDAVLTLINRQRSAAKVTVGLIKQRDKHPRTSPEYQLYAMLGEHADWTSEGLHKELVERITISAFAKDKLLQDEAK